MLVFCSDHQKNFGHDLFLGDKKPHWDRSISHGICDDCMRIMEAKIEEHQEKEVAAVSDNEAA